MNWIVAFFILFASLMMHSLSASAQSTTGWPACPSNGQRVSAYTDVSMGKLQYHLNTSATQLRGMSRRITQRLGPFWVPLGLTVADENYTIDLAFDYYQLGPAQYCGVLKDVRLFLGYRNIDVYVINKYPRHSCEHRSVLDHENVHVQVLRDTLHHHSRRIQQTLRERAPRVGPVYHHSLAALKRALYDRLNAHINPLFQQMSREMTRRNARIDTKENYRREQALCSNW